MICVKCYVTGKVQGVFFRANTQEKARSLHLVGWAKNLADGRVEVLACGEQQEVEQLLVWLWEGSPESTVAEVTHENVSMPTPIPQDFLVK